MVDEFNALNIKKGEYEFDISKYFFSSDDIIHIIIIIYIIISFIFNCLYFITVLKAKFTKEKHQLNIIIMGSILFINFLHTFSYLYEWVLQNVDGKNSLYVDDEGEICIENNGNCKDNKSYNEIGGLLIGNMSNMAACKTQGFFLVFCSLSQDILINIFLYLINKSRTLSKFKIYLLILAGTLFPFVISIILVSINGIGLNDKFCFIKKFSFDKDNQTYKIYSGFLPMIIVYYILRIINIIISSCLLYRIVKYISGNNLGKKYIIKLCSFVIVQLFTIVVGLMYRLGGFVSRKFNRDFVNVFLVINTIDGIVFPLVSYFSNNMYKILCIKNSESEYNIDFLFDDSGGNDLTTANITLQNQAQNDKSGISSSKSNQNNFSVSYLWIYNNFYLKYIKYIIY